MRPLNALEWIALILVVVGGINWGLIGLFDFNLVALLLGDMTLLARIVYVLVGISAIYVIIALPWKRASASK